MSCWPTCKQEFDSVYFFLPSDTLENCFVPWTSHGPISYLPVFRRWFMQLIGIFPEKKKKKQRNWEEGRKEGRERNRQEYKAQYVIMPLATAFQVPHSCFFSSIHFAMIYGVKIGRSLKIKIFILPQSQYIKHHSNFPELLFIFNPDMIWFTDYKVSQQSFWSSLTEKTYPFPHFY